MNEKQKLLKEIDEAILEPIRRASKKEKVRAKGIFKAHPLTLYYSKEGLRACYVECLLHSDSIKTTEIKHFQAGNCHYHIYNQPNVLYAFKLRVKKGYPSRLLYYRKPKRLGVPKRTSLKDLPEKLKDKFGQCYDVLIERLGE